MDKKDIMQSDIRAMMKGHDRALREAAEKEHGGYITDATWEMMKESGEASGCNCGFCVSHRS